MTKLNPGYFLNKITALLTAPGTYDYDVAVFKGLRSNLTGEYTLQIYPANLREETRAENVVACTDTWQIAGVVKTDEEDMLPKLLAFAEDTKAALDTWAEEDAGFTSAILPDMQFTYDGYPTVVFNLQLEIKYLRRIK